MNHFATLPGPSDPFQLRTSYPREDTHRKVVGLLHAWETEAPAKGVFTRKKRSETQKEGIRFERSLTRLLPKGSRQGVWFEFYDQNGRGICQTDWIVPIGREAVLIIECKRTECPEATTQLSQLYLPVVSRAFAKPAYGLIMVKFLTQTTPQDRLYSELPMAIEAAQIGIIPIVHHWR